MRKLLKNAFFIFYYKIIYCCLFFVYIFQEFKQYKDLKANLVQLPFT